jgi:NAD(P)H-hydrate epimerase
MPINAALTEPSDVVSVLPPRAVDAHKRASGTLVVVAGSRTMTGAVKLVARGAGRAGAGYVIVAAPESILPTIQTELTECVFLPLAESPQGVVSEEAVPIVLQALEGAHALAIGPGLGRDESATACVRALVRESSAPIVMDADALNAFAGEHETLRDRKADAVLTPHVGELTRLVGHPLGDRTTEARSLAAASEAVVLLKGTRTVIATPDGELRINPTGTPALATAGTGDVLTGGIGALLARGLQPFAAAWAGAYLHGLAGLLASGDLGDGVLASDVAERLPWAIARVEATA